MHVYIIEYRMRQRTWSQNSTADPNPWKLALGLHPATQHEGECEQFLKLRGMHDNCEYRVVRYVREP